MSFESDMRRAVDECDIQRLLSSYNRFHDDRRTRDLVQLFTADARLKVMGKDLVGQDVIAEFFGPPPETPIRASGQHLLSNVLIEVTGDEASAVSDYTFIRRDAAGETNVVLAGRYHDVLARTSAGWRFRVREATALGRTRD
ncbi:hypothetical protein BH10PSE1_BH10PSE1_05690 [soil metagenome]